MEREKNSGNENKSTSDLFNKSITNRDVIDVVGSEVVTNGDSNLNSEIFPSHLYDIVSKTAALDYNELTDPTVSFVADSLTNNLCASMDVTAKLFPNSEDQYKPINGAIAPSSLGARKLMSEDFTAHPLAVTADFDDVSIFGHNNSIIEHEMDYGLGTVEINADYDGDLLGANAIKIDGRDALTSLSASVDFDDVSIFGHNNSIIEHEMDYGLDTVNVASLPQFSDHKSRWRLRATGDVNEISNECANAVIKFILNNSEYDWDEFSYSVESDLGSFQINQKIIVIMKNYTFKNSTVTGGNFGDTYISAETYIENNSIVINEGRELIREIYKADIGEDEKEEYLKTLQSIDKSSTIKKDELGIIQKMFNRFKEKGMDIASEALFKYLFKINGEILLVLAEYSDELELFIKSLNLL